MPARLVDRGDREQRRGFATVAGRFATGDPQPDLGFMMLAKKPPLLFTLGTALLILGGGTLAYWGLSQRGAASRGLPTGVRAVPENALATVTFSTNEEAWQQLRQFGTPETQASFDQQLARWRDRWLTAYDLSFAQHIAPWVGPEVTLIILPDAAPGVPPEATDSLIPGTQHRVLVLPIADAEAAQTTFDTLPIPPEAADTTDYRGVELNPYSSPANGEQTVVWVGVLGSEFVLVADDETAAKAVIDTYKGGKSVADLPGYSRAFEQATADLPFSKVYVDVPAMSQYLAQSAQPPLPAAALNAFQASRGLAATVTLAPRGLQIRSVSWLQSGSDRTYTAPNVPAKLPQFLPQDTLIMASGSQFQQFWGDLRDRQTWGALTALNPDSLDLALQASTGLSLEEDLLPWMAGEFAMALIPSPTPSQPGETAPLPSPNLVLLAQAQDRPAAEKTFNQLDTVVRSRYRFTISPVQRNDFFMTEWTSPFAALTLTHGWLSNDILFLTLGEKTAEAIAPPPRRPLATAPLFQLMTAAAPAVNSGYFYLNLEALQQTNDQLFAPQLPPDSQGLLQAIQGLGVTATVLDERRLRYDLYVALQRGDRPGSLPAAEAPAPESTPDPPPAPNAPPGNP